jgi:hypothetical protein
VVDFGFSFSFADLAAGFVLQVFFADSSPFPGAGYAESTYIMPEKAK